MSGRNDPHGPYEDLAVRHVMGALDEAEGRAFRSHLLDCAECRARVGELRSIASDLAGVERDERRQRAMQQVETKEREAAAEEAEQGAGYVPPRSSRVLVIVGVLLIVVLSVWNFVLRGQNDGLHAALQAEQDSAATINFGEPWVTEIEAVGVEGIARVEDSAVAVMVRGTDDDAPYEVSFYDAAGERRFVESVRSVDELVRYFRGPMSTSVTRIDVTLDRSSGDTVVFRATRPADDPAIVPVERSAGAAEADGATP